MSDVAAVVPSIAQSTKLGFLDRITDRLNPILVREVHQALNGKAFVATAALAMMGILTIALIVASQDEVSPRDGAQAFQNTLLVLIPILFFIVPFQAFFSMRSEVGGGTVEHLLMSRLSPARFIRGKLLATTVQFAIYLAIFSPLLAMTFLLRGVDVPTIAVMLTVLFVGAVACSALGIACGALCRWRAFFRVIPFAVALVGLGVVTASAMGGLEDVVRSLRRVLGQDDFLYSFAAFSMMPIVATVLFSMIGSAALAHPYENRSTKFRLFALGFTVLAFGWTIFNYNRTVRLGSGVSIYFPLSQQLVVAGTMCGTFLCLFPFFASTESPNLTPRVRRHVPRNRLLAFLAAPFLPGCGRGLQFTILLGGLVLLGARCLPSFWGASIAGASFGGASADPLWPVLLCVWLYILFFSAVGCAVRSRFSDLETRNWWARGVLPISLMLSVLIPLITSVVGSGRSVMARWSPLHLLNPFYTISKLRRNEDEIFIWLGTITAIAVLFNVVTMVRGTREVLAASRSRRTRAR